MTGSDPSYDQALRKAFRSLAARDRSEREIRTRLKAGAFDDATVDSVVKRLYELGYLDDAAVARRWARNWAAEQLMSDRRIEARLAQRGMDRGVIREALEEIRRDVSEEEAVRRILRKEASRPIRAGTPDRRKWVRRLLGLGFPPEAVFDTLRKSGNEEEDVP
jgi:regulatory protein